jgi:tetratricopeptide (TPR) repeat protein
MFAFESGQSGGLAAAKPVRQQSNGRSGGRHVRRIGRIVVLLIFTAFPLLAQTQAPPLTQDEVRELIKKNKKDPDLVYKTLDERNVDFDLNRAIEKKMRKAGADDAVLQAIWKAGPTSKTAKTALLTSPVGVQLRATYEEALGFKTLEDELDPDRRIRMVGEFESRFPNSQLLSYVYTQAAKAYEQKGDLGRVVDYGEKSLKFDAGNVQSMLLVAMVLPQPRMLRAEPQAATQRLITAESYARRALKLVEGLPRTPNETDDQLQKRKASLASDAHTALAMVNMQRGESANAIEEFKTAISLATQPNPQLYFRMGEVYANDGHKAEAIEAFTKAAELGQGTALQKYADGRIAALKKP